MANNPLPRHGGPNVNALEDNDEGLVKDVSKVKAYMKEVHENLSEEGLIEGVHDKCKVCLSAPDKCEKFKTYL